MITEPVDNDFHVTVRWQGPSTVVLALSGELDYDTSGELVGQVEEALTGQPDLRELLLDCRGLELVDSMGLSALLRAHRAATARGVRFRLDHRSTGLERMLTVTGTFEHLTATTPPPSAEAG
ncbi:STAS domain-containing protein [Streptomyces phytohabitans]|uniref:STAS domain-containing protein n=1 Tax=Streptomyces phytohabitans TaxID=1150371 RepID=UPI00345C55C2